MGSSEKSDSGASRWPTGTAFLMYCGGISLILLVGYVIFSGKGFDFSANEKGIAFKSALNQGAASNDPEVRAEKSKELQEKFAKVAQNASSEISDNTDPIEPNRDFASEDLGLEANPSPTPVRNVAHPVRAQRPLASRPPINPFNGSWTGNGSTYVFEQNGSTVALMETTNGIATSFAQGTANGSHATLMAANISGLTFPVEVHWDGARIKLTAMGTEFFLDPG